jgi:hypothetical protein
VLLGADAYSPVLTAALHRLAAEEESFGDRLLPSNGQIGSFLAGPVLGP